MRALKYANYFSEKPVHNQNGASEMIHETLTSPEIAAERTVTRKALLPRQRRSGLSAVDDKNNPTQPEGCAEESDLFSEALTEADDTVDGDDRDVYRPLHRVSFAPRPPRPDYDFKVCIVGNVSVGKTTLLLTLTNKSDGENQINRVATPKVGVGQREKFVFSQAKQKLAKCRLEDTAGQERYKSLTSNFYRNCLGCLVVFDVTREETFNDVDRWFKDVRMYAEAEICVVLVAANNVSILAGEEEEEAAALAQRRVISVDEGLEKAQQYEVPYVEANVRKDAEATAALETLVDAMIDKIEKR